MLMGVHGGTPMGRRLPTLIAKRLKIPKNATKSSDVNPFVVDDMAFIEEERSYSYGCFYYLLLLAGETMAMA